MHGLSLVPRPPPSVSIICGSGRAAKNREGQGTCHMMQGGCRGAVPILTLVWKKMSSLPVKSSAVNLVNVWGAGYYWKTKSSTLFECGLLLPPRPPPDVIHVTGSCLMTSRIYLRKVHLVTLGSILGLCGGENIHIWPALATFKTC